MQPQSGNPAVRQGLIYGGLTILVTILQDIIQFAVGGADALTNQGSSRGVPGLGTIVFVIGLVLLFLAGMSTTRQNGKVDSAAVAGFLAALIGGLFSGVIAVILLATGPIPTTGTSTGIQISRTDVIIGSMFGSIVVVLLYAGLGAGVGAIGGLVGRRTYQSRYPAPSDQESMYQGLQQPGTYPPLSERQSPQYPSQLQNPLGAYGPPPPQYPQQ
ncbi:MAG: hypothetical protein ACXVA4_01415 [Ktedonobacterales bacterium]